ncbi:U4/U6 small nuclear ribonucleoprotein Prp31 [Chamberlinius hualienensis]
MSLADELLADLEDGGDVEDDQLSAQVGMAVEVEDICMETDNNSVRQIAKLRNSEQLARVMEKLEIYHGQKESKSVFGPMESDPEYQLIVDANNLAAEVDNEINIIHKFVRDKYSKRFPELESLVPSALEYVAVVKELGNDLDRAKSNERLQQIITPATIMVVSVTASTTQGHILNSDELDRIEEACTMALELDAIKLKIYDYVESRMSFIAPNLSVIVGASTATKLMGIAGGLTNLSKMPSCNLLVLGAQKRTLSGFSSTATLPHTGVVYYCSIVQGTPPDLRRKAARLVSAKCTLAARVDHVRSSTNGSYGHSLREEIERKLDKLQEPPPVKQVKPLPAPIDQQRKKRGGKRVRKMKERYGMTELRKQANRMNFGEIEEDAYQDDLGFSVGQIGKSGTGRIRRAQIDERTKVRISKTLQKNLQKQQVFGGASTVRKQISGVASSVAFTPLQGLEIVNPQAAEIKVAAANAKYFSNTAGFLKVAPDSKP